MARFPTESERSITLRVPLAQVYEFFWDVLGSANCVPGLDTCKRAGPDTYRFVYKARSTGEAEG